MENKTNAAGYRWVVLVLATLTNTLVSAVPSMCMPVLFKEIAIDLHLNLIQVGLVWGISALPGIFTVLLGGAIGDRYGPKRILVASCVLVGLTGALRGLATSFSTLTAVMFLMGIVSPVISMNTFKACSTWFSGKQMGLASGVLSMGMAFGFLTSSMISATFLSPWLGGWGHVLFFYGGISLLMAIPWYFVRTAPGASGSVSRSSLGENMIYIARMRKIWLYGLAILGFNGCVQGTLGYLPLYLRGFGWAPVSADGATSAFYLASMCFVVPIALLSDRLGTRKKVLLAGVVMMTVGVSLLSVVNGAGVWAAVCTAGMVRDGFMAVFMTAILESEGVGPAYAGTATGMVMVFSGLGSLLAPPLGNSLASTAPGLPFVFWSAMLLMAFTGLLAAREYRARRAVVIDV